MIHIFVDVDNTLVSTLPWEMAHCVEEGGHRLQKLASMSAKQLQESVCGERDVVVKSCGTYISRLRPGAAEFLERLGGLGTVFALSFGSSKFVADVMAAQGLRGFFQETYGREDYRKVPKVGRSGLLVDDRHPGDPLSIQKLAAMGSLKSPYEVMAIAEKQYVQVEPFHGWLEDDYLKLALEQVLEKAEKLGGANGSVR